MNGLLNRVGRLEAAAGIGEPCEVCELIEEFVARLAPKLEEWQAGPDEGPRPDVTVACHWCGVSRPAGRVGMTEAEVEAYKRMEALYWRGEVCQPEYEAAAATVAAAFSRLDRAKYGEERAAEIEAMCREFNADLDLVRQAPLPYLCRVPGCQCEYPKTLAEWRVNATANGYRLRGFIAAA